MSMIVTDVTEVIVQYYGHTSQIIVHYYVLTSQIIEQYYGYTSQVIVSDSIILFDTYSHLGLHTHPCLRAIYR
jgi:hypothetical protein